MRPHKAATTQKTAIGEPNDEFYEAKGHIAVARRLAGASPFRPQGRSEQ
jgi:hypothetical protein